MLGWDKFPIADHPNVTVQRPERPPFQNQDASRWSALVIAFFLVRRTI
jgi:hypothetical protein